ncbi:MAG: IS607 family transposase [Promethearchaeota archaeon]
MFTREVCRLLQITKVTLYKYQREGKVKEHKHSNGYWNWDDESVYLFLNKGVPRKKYAYARVSTNKQKPDLENQIQLLKQWCFSNGIQLNGKFSDVASGISFEKRKNFFKMLQFILQKRVDKAIITYKDRLSRVGFELFSYLFKQFGTENIVISEVRNPKLDSQDIIKEIISLMQCFAMKLYSKRKRKVIQELIKEVY